MLVLSPALTASPGVVLPPGPVTGYLRRRIRDAERATRTAVGALNTQLQEDLTGVEVIRAFGRQTAFADRFRSTLAAGCAPPTVHLLQLLLRTRPRHPRAAATAALLWLGGGGATRSVGVSIGTLTAFVLLFAKFFTPLINLGDEWQNVQAALAGAERVFTVLALPTSTRRPATRRPHRAAPASDAAPGDLTSTGSGSATRRDRPCCTTSA